MDLEKFRHILYSITMLYTIYSITIRDTDFVYIGSTKDYNSRVKTHKRNTTLPETRKAHHYKLYKMMREHGLEKCEFKIVENLDCEKSYAIEREAYWVNQLIPDIGQSGYCLKKHDRSLNSIRPVCHLTKAERCREYYATHQEERKKYIEDNRERIAEVARKHYEANRDHNLERAKEYRETHKEQIKASNSSYIAMPPIQCECGGTYTYKHKARHEATIPHRLGTDPVFKQQYDEETAKRKEEQKQRKREYKAQWYQAQKSV